MQLRHTLRSELQEWQDSDRPGVPDKVYSVPHFQQ